MEKTQQKRIIRSFDVISVFIMVGLCALATYPVFNSEKGENGYKALHRAEGLAYQLVEIHKNLNIPVASHEQARSIASEASEDHLRASQGEIGLDPWGRAYQFQILKNQGVKPKIAVWSLGENGKSESVANNFQGDDIGVLVDLR